VAVGAGSTGGDTTEAMEAGRARRELIGSLAGVAAGREGATGRAGAREAAQNSCVQERSATRMRMAEPRSALSTAHFE
jgi:hypothetical protein